MKEQLVHFAMNAGIALVMLCAGAFAIKLLSKALGRAFTRVDGRHALAARFLTSVAEKVAWAFLVVAVLSRLGVDVGPIVAGLGVTGFILGFAFQESLGSLASGLMIAVNQPFKVGDYVVVAGHEGKVTQLDMMAITLATPDNRKITIPNKSAWGQPIVNFSALELRRVDIAVGVDYGTDLALAKRIALGVISSTPGVLADPAPMAEVKTLDESSVALTVRGWAKNADYWKVYFAAVPALKDAFDGAGIRIPFRQLDVNIKSAPAEKANMV